MKYIIAADIHGSALYGGMLLDRFEAEGADQLLLLGDILYHGPRNDLPDGYAPKVLIERLNAMADRILCVRGNCDALVDQMVLDFPLLDEMRAVDLDGVPAVMIHGHQLEGEGAPRFDKGTVVLCGHTHIPVCIQTDFGVQINPGSVSIPKQNSHRGYITVENGLFTWKDLQGKMVREYRYE